MLEGSCLCGNVGWRFAGIPTEATACNCTACRRYGALWAYGWEGGGVEVRGETRAHVRPVPDAVLGFHFCPECGCVAYWRGLAPGADGRRRIAVNLRLAEPEAVADVAIRRFDGLGRFSDLPRDGRCVRDYWF